MTRRHEITLVETELENGNYKYALMVAGQVIAEYQPYERLPLNQAARALLQSTGR